MNITASDLRAKTDFAKSTYGVLTKLLGEATSVAEHGGDCFVIRGALLDDLTPERVAILESRGFVVKTGGRDFSGIYARISW